MIDLPDKKDEEKKETKVNWEDLIFKYRHPLVIFLIGAILVSLGVFFVKKSSNGGSSKIEVLESVSENENGSLELIVEVVGAVEKPGVYSLEKNARIEDALIAAGGISADADREWMEKVINRAAKIIDGQKIYISHVGEQSDVLSASNNGGYQSTSSNISDQGSGLININTVSQKELESLYGIGPVYAQNIIEHRPYSTVEELVSKGALKQYVYEKVKDKVGVY